LDELSLPSVIEEAIGSVQAYAEQQRVTIESHIADATIEGDRLRLIQVLVNLLANAIKFSPPGSSVRVSATFAADVAMVEVADSGPGIDVSDQQIIFEPYKQVKGSDKRLDGTGWD